MLTRHHPRKHFDEVKSIWLRVMLIWRFCKPNELSSLTQYFRLAGLIKDLPKRMGLPESISRYSSDRSRAWSLGNHWL